MDDRVICGNIFTSNDKKAVSTRFIGRMASILFMSL